MNQTLRLLVKALLLVSVLPVLALAACAGAPTTSNDPRSATIAVPGNSGSTPVTLSGYVESSYTAHPK